MNILLCPFVVIIFTVLPLTSCQNPVPIQFQSSPVLVATGNNAVFTVQTISNIFSITWLAPGGATLGQWINSQAVLNPIGQYQGRVSISATQLTISNSQLSDAGNYTVSVTPSAPTGLATNSRSVALSVFVAVGGVNLLAPSVATEGGNTSLVCSWTSGTNPNVTWGKGSASLPSDPRFIINAGSLIINPVNRNDAGQYSCTVSNPISSQTATASLTVYYGPDTPQVTKTSSDCVGGGDATVGQTAQLTCTSVSLPPALLSWQFNGVPLTASQANGGTLNLQIFSTNQSGQYTCSAQNSATTHTSQQQVGLSVVGTCLSIGAVAGIVVACFVALALIIVAIILILRQRNVDQRLRTVIAERKENLNNRPTVIPAPQNGHDNPGFLGQGDQYDPPVHNNNRFNHSKNQHSTNSHTNRQPNNGDDMMTMQNRSANTGTVQPSGHLNTDMLSNNADLNSSAHLHNNQRNSNSSRHNTGLFQEVGQQNPNIVIQAGHTEPGHHTVLINLNTLPQQQTANTQPQTVQVSLGAPFLQQPNQNTMHSDDQQASTIQQDLANVSHSNLRHVSESHSTPQTWVDNTTNTAQPAFSRTSRNGQLRDHRATNQTRRNTEDTRPYSERTRTHLGHTLSTAVADSDANSHPSQMPWDYWHGTPAYPNQEMDSYESQYSTPVTSSSDSDGEHSVPALRPRRSDVDQQVRNISRASRRNLLRQLAHSAAQRRFPVNRAVSRQMTEPNVINQPHADYQSQTAPQNITSQRHAVDNITTAISVRQPTPVQIQTTQPAHLPSQSGPDQRPGRSPNSHMLTQAALQQNTSQTSVPFVNWNQLTHASLQHPVTQSGPAQNLPAKQANRAGQEAPPPPPVLRPEEFKTLPLEHLKSPHAVKPPQGPRQPVVMHRGHRPINMLRNAKNMHNNPHKRPANPHMRANAHRHGNSQGFPLHASQVHRSRHRP